MFNGAPAVILQYLSKLCSLSIHFSVAEKRYWSWRTNEWQCVPAHVDYVFHTCHMCFLAENSVVCEYGLKCVSVCLSLCVCVLLRILEVFFTLAREPLGEMRGWRGAVKLFSRCWPVRCIASARTQLSPPTSVSVRLSSLCDLFTAKIYLFLL